MQMLFGKLGSFLYPYIWIWINNFIIFYNCLIKKLPCTFIFYAIFQYKTENKYKIN